MLVQINDLTKRFGTFTALDSVDLEIKEGEVFGLLGPNGAGKSTLIRTLLGFLNPTSGRATIDDLDCHQDRVKVHHRVSYLPGDARLYRMMKAKSVLRLQCSFRDQRCYERALKIADRLELDLNRWVGLMSTGMRQKLALAITLAADVPLLILDEPTANLDPSVRSQILAMVGEAREAGKAVIFSSHVLSEIEETCDRVGILRAGKLVYQSSLDAINQQHRIRAKLDGALSDPPVAIRDTLTIKHEGDHVQIETPGELSAVLKWLADAALSDVYVQPVGLRAIYDRFHYPEPTSDSKMIEAGP